jgi:putative tryptophan/tyrosine transport system substrate-binding protein
MQRRQFIRLLGGGAAWPLAARAQQASKIRRIGVLGGASRQSVTQNYAGFQQGMRELGYLEERDYVTELRAADGQYDRLKDLADELVRLRCDVILTGTSLAAQVLQQATHTIPIVLSGVSDPIGTGLVTSLTHPTGNTTGVSSLFNISTPKQLEILAQIAPNTSRIGMLANPNNPTHPLTVNNVQAAARQARLDLVSIDARNVQEIDDAFAAFDRQGVQAVLITGDALFLGQRRLIVGHALQQRLPTMFSQREFAEDGGLMSYGEGERDFFRRAASYVDKIFKGAAPADLPVEQPTRFHLVINLTTAKLLGLTVPPSLLALADEVIE